MTRQLDGIIHGMGEHDTGKTLFSLQCGARPEKICFIDDDIKGRATVKELRENLSEDKMDLGAYYDLVELHKGKREVEFHQAVMSIIDKIRPGDYDAIIFDNWTRFASTCHAMVLKNPSAYREHWSPMGKIKGAEQHQEAQHLEAQILNRLGELAKTVIVTTHLKDHYLNDARTGKMIPACSKTLERVPVMRVWLRMNPSGRPVPIGLFLKRPSRSGWDEKAQAIRSVNILPRKVTPLESEQSLWDAIWRYWDNPFGDRKPNPEEMPDEYELSILDGTLTRDQARTLQLMVEKGLVSHDEETLPEEPARPSISIGTSEKEDVIRKALYGGTPAPIVARELGVPLPEVLKVKAKMQ